MTRPKPEPRSAIVVARDHDDRQATFLAQLGQYLIQQGHRRCRRHRAVVDVTSNQHRIHALTVDDRQQLLQDMTLVVQQREIVKQPTQMPVGGMK